MCIISQNNAILFTDSLNIQMQITNGVPPGLSHSKPRHSLGFTAENAGWTAFSEGNKHPYNNQTNYVISEAFILNETSFPPIYVKMPTLGVK